jgi:hypothetical protein
MKASERPVRLLSLRVPPPVRVVFMACVPEAVHSLDQPRAGQKRDLRHANCRGA